MGLRQFFRRLDKRVGRFNRWLGPAAIAANTKTGDESGRVDPSHVTAIVGEIEHPEKPRRD